MNFRKFCSKVLELGADEAASLAVECFDNVRDLKRAFDHICVVFRRELTRDFVKQRMMAHAQVSGYDNSEELVRSL